MQYIGSTRLRQRSSTGAWLITKPKVVGDVLKASSISLTLRGIMVAKWQQWMPFYIDSFMGSPAVQAMHPTARIGYLCLLARAWQTEDCTVPSDALELAEKSGLGDELWATHGARILRKFDTVEGSDRLRNAVLYEKWQEARRVYEKRREAADRTNTERSPSRSPHEKVTVTVREPSRLADTQTTVVPVDVSVSVPVDLQDLSVLARCLCEELGIFDIREQEAVHRFLGAKSEGNPEVLMERVKARWKEYQDAIPQLSYSNGSAHKWLMSGKWDNPRSWPWAKSKASEREQVWEKFMNAPTEDGS